MNNGAGAFPSPLQLAGGCSTAPAFSTSTHDARHPDHVWAAGVVHFRGGAMTEWVDERLHDGWGQRFQVVRILAHVQSAYQDIVVFESAAHGRVLMLDGAVQITEADEFVYQEMLAHVPLLAHGAAKRVLIIGAGDGGVLRRVLQHRSVVEAVMVEIDAEVIRLAREFLPGISGDAWSDARAHVIVGDGIQFMADAPAKSFDVVIVDSTDPSGPGEVLFSDTFYRDCSRVLGEGGLLVNQGGVPFMQPGELQNATQRRAKAFAHVSAFMVAVPTYVGGFMALGIAGNTAVWAGQTPALLEERAEAAGILGQTRYWSPDVHTAAFALPPYVLRLLEPDAKV